MKFKWLVSLGLIPFISNAQNFNYPHTDTTGMSYKNIEVHEVVSLNENQKFSKQPKNIIFLIGDGMGTSEVFAGYTANGGKLNLMNMPVTGFSMTQSADNYITDSSAGGTALSTGTRTNNGVIGLDADSIPVKSILEIGEEQGKATGLVSTCSIVHATPASFIAHQPSRDMYEEIANDFLKTDIDVFIGGGKQYFETRKDGRNLLDSLTANGYTICTGTDEIQSTDASKLAGFIADGHAENMPARGEALSIATQKALDVVSNNKKGFFLMVEGSMIDWGGHANNVEFITRETLDFDKAVGIALEFASKDKNTLVVVTADHETGGLAINGGSIEDNYVEAGFTTKNHTAVMVPVFAYGAGAEQFTGIYKNIEVFYKMLNSWDIPSKLVDTFH